MATYGGPNFNIGETYKNLTDRVKEDNGSLIKPNANDLQQVLSSGLSLNPSLLNYPIGKESTSIYSMVPSDGTGDLICSRNGTATYFDKDGIIRTAAPNEPRLDFDPVTGEFKGVLVEEAATNYFPNNFYSNIVNVINNNCIFNVIPNGGLWGLNSFEGVVQDSYTGGQIQLRFTINLPAGLYTHTFYVKKNSNFRRIEHLGSIVLNSEGENQQNFVFNEETGDITASSGIKIYQSEDFGDWWKVWYVIESLGGDALIDYEPDYYIGARIEIFGSQIENGIKPSSFIPTEGSIVTRPADIINLPNYSTLFGERNNRLVTINGENKIYINESNLQLPVGHNKLLLEKQDFFTEQEQTDLSATTATYGVREDIKDELNEVLALNPSLVMIPGKGEAGNLQTLVPNDGTGDFTVSRNGTATYLGKDGLLKTAQANEPRLVFNPDGSFKGVLVEPAATNLFPVSENFFTPWVTVGLLLVENQLISPDGTNSSTKVTIGIDSSSTRHRIYLSNRTITSGLTYTGSYFLKKGNHRWVQLVYVSTSAFSINAWANFDLETGTIGTVASDAIAKIEDYGNGWYRCSVTTTAIGSATTTALEILTTNNTNSGRYPSYQSTVEEDVCYVWGAQLEVGSVATSYIPTEGTTVTRPADIIQKTNALDLIGQESGGIYCEFNTNILQNGMISVGSGISNHISMYLRSNGFTNLETRFNGEFRAISQSIKSYSINTKNKFLISYSLNGYNVFLNGLKVTSSFIAPVFSNQLNTIVFSLTNNNIRYQGNISNLSLFKTPLTDEQAIALTTL